MELSGATATPRGQVKAPASLPRVPIFIRTFRFCMYWCLDEDVINPDGGGPVTSSELRRPLAALFPETPMDRARLNRDDVGSACFPPPAVVVESLLVVADGGWPSPSLFLGPYLFFK